MEIVRIAPGIEFTVEAETCRLEFLAHVRGINPVQGIGGLQA